MNREVAKAMLPLFDDVWRYFGCDGYGISFFKYKKDFCPGVGPVSFSPPSQLVYSARHCGVFKQMDGLGGPDLTRKFIAQMDGIPYLVMREAVDYVDNRDLVYRTELFRTLWAVSRRPDNAKKYEVAENLCLSRPALDDRLKDACILVLEFLDDWLEREVNKRNQVN